jgi:hypothetical protein
VVELSLGVLGDLASQQWLASKGRLTGIIENRRFSPAEFK